LKGILGRQRDTDQITELKLELLDELLEELEKKEEELPLG
jgi:hypothetical protein